MEHMIIGVCIIAIVVIGAVVIFKSKTKATNKAQSDHPQTENFRLSAPVLEMAGQSNSRNRPSAQDPETGTTGHGTKRIAHAGTTWSQSANRSPSAWHRRLKQAPKRKTRHGRRFRNGSVPLPVPIPLLCKMCIRDSYYLVGDYLELPGLAQAEFEQAVADAVLLWER